MSEIASLANNADTQIHYFGSLRQTVINFFQEVAVVLLRWESGEELMLFCHCDLRSGHRQILAQADIF